MSEIVGYKGKLKLCKKYKDADELQSNLQDFWQSVPREERNQYYKDVEEIDEYELEDNGYIVIDGNCIYKVELEDFDAYDDFVEITQVQDGVYEFITQFYNGSTDLQEMLQEGFDKRR
jgi:hypothetical protein